MSLLDVYRTSKGEVFFRDPVSESVAARPSRVGEKESLEISDRERGVTKTPAFNQLSG